MMIIRGRTLAAGYSSHAWGCRKNDLSRERRYAASESPPAPSDVPADADPQAPCNGCPTFRLPPSALLPAPTPLRSAPLSAGGREVPPGEKTSVLGSHANEASDGTKTSESRAK